MRLFQALLLLYFPGASAPAQSPTYWQDVRPALRKYCIACHNARNLGEVDVSGGLALDSYDALMKKARHQVLHPGKSADSLIMQRLTSKDDNFRMPPGDRRLPEETVALIRRWIDAGAAEGKKPDDTTVIVTPTPSRRRKLPISLPTTATPPAGLLAPGAAAKLELILRVGPLSPVTAIVFSPDGKLLASGCYGRVTVWDLEMVRPIKVLTNVLGAVNDLRFSPDGKLLAVAGGQPSAEGDLRLFEVAGWKLKAVLRGHRDVVSSVAFRPDGQKIASASFDKTIRVWDLVSLKTEEILEPHTDFVYAVAWSPDGKWLASASKDRTVKLIEVAARTSRLTFSGMTDDVLAVGFSGDGKYVLSSGVQSGIHWWNAKTGERIRLQPGHGSTVNELAVSKDGKLIVSGSQDATVRLWDGSTGTLRTTLQAGSLVYAVALGPDSRLAAAGSLDGLVRVWDVKTGRHLLTLLGLPAHGDEGDWLALTPEGYAVASKALTDAGEWRMAGRSVAAAAVWKSLARGDVVIRAAHGEALPPVTFQK